MLQQTLVGWYVLVALSVAYVTWDFVKYNPEVPVMKWGTMRFIESFNGGVRRELLNPSYFETIDRARTAARIWREEYNDIRPHSMRANQTPKEFAAAARIKSGSRFSNVGPGLRTG